MPQHYRHVKFSSLFPFILSFSFHYFLLLYVLFSLMNLHLYSWLLLLYWFLWRMNKFCKYMKPAPSKINLLIHVDVKSFLTMTLSSDFMKRLGKESWSLCDNFAYKNTLLFDELLIRTSLNPNMSPSCLLIIRLLDLGNTQFVIILFQQFVLQIKYKITLLAP